MKVTTHMTKINSVDFKKGDTLLLVYGDHPAYRSQRGRIITCPQDVKDHGPVDCRPAPTSTLLRSAGLTDAAFARRFIKLDKDTYKVGDRVIGVGEFQGRNIAGREGVVVKNGTYEPFHVDFGEGFDGHKNSGQSLTGKPTCWYVPATALLPADLFKDFIKTPFDDGKPAPQPTGIVTAAQFKVGDKVRCHYQHNYERYPARNLRELVITAVNANGTYTLGPFMQPFHVPMESVTLVEAAGRSDMLRYDLKKGDKVRIADESEAYIRHKGVDLLVQKDVSWSGVAKLGECAYQAPTVKLTSPSGDSLWPCVTRLVVVAPAAAPTMSIPVTPAPIPDTGEFVLMLWEDGTYKPSPAPKVLTSYRQAKRVAREMTERHGGQFVIFKAVAKSEAKPITRYESDLVELVLGWSNA